MTALQWRYADAGSLGAVVPDRALHALLRAGKIGDPPDHRPLAIYNADPTVTISALRVWTSLGAGGGAFAIGLAPEGVVPATSGGIVSAFSGVTFTTPTTRAGGLAISSLAPGQAIGVWIRRSLATGAAATPELNRLHVAGSMPL